MFDFKIDSKTTANDKGARRIRREIEKMGNGVSITSGIHMEQAIQLPKYNGVVDGQIPIGQYARWQEFGLTRTKVGDIPPRPFIRSTFAEKKGTFVRQTITGLRRIYKGSLTVDGLLTLQGKRIKTWIKAKIITLRDPPNAPLTLLIKRMKQRGSNPLVFSRSMHGSITSKSHYPAKRRYKKLTVLSKKIRMSLEKLNP